MAPRLPTRGGCVARQKVHKMMPLPPTALLRAVFNYNPDTGVFTHAVSKRGRRCRTGDVAGTVGKNGYVYLSFDCRRYLAQRVAWKIVMGVDPISEVDHKNRIRHDNRWGNLRLVTDEQNAWNAGLSAANTSGFKGVSYRKDTNRWTARIRVGGCYRSAGCFDSRHGV